ncbi:MAG: YqgE/AlgH family protein [Bacteroidales bacterium]|nr:YqgE/AlgH family protein [Bacteroidales bacterium]
MEKNIDFFKIDKNETPSAGKVLISEPYSYDKFFDRTVVVLAEHNEKGSVGFVLNKPTKLIIDDIIDGFPSFRSLVSIGGPVAPNTLHYIHTLGNILPESVEISDGLYWGGDYEHLKFLIESKIIRTDQIRFFIGYSGWAANQLQRELKENNWLVGNIEKEVILKNINEDIWRKMLKETGEKYSLWADFPQDPSMN